MSAIGFSYCRTCGDCFITGLRDSPESDQCRDCVLFLRKGSRVHDHPILVRCPQCGALDNLRDSEAWDLFQHGDHEYQCRECDAKFNVQTDVTYSFTSPPLVTPDAVLDD